MGVEVMMVLQLLVACAAGALLMYGCLRWRGFEDAEVKRLRAKLTAKTDELVAYKSDVREHFLSTAKAVDALTRAQQDVFAQLEGDAQRLVGDGLQNALNPHAATGSRPPQLVTVRKAVDERETADEATGKPVDQEDKEVLDNPASAGQRPVHT